MKEIFLKAFSLTLLAMFFFISLTNAMYISGSMLIMLSLFINIAGIMALGPLMMKKSWADKPIIAWLVFYLGFLAFNVLNGWLVNTTGYMMLLLALSLLFLVRERAL